MKTYLNPAVTHQRDQQPVIIEGMDGCSLPAFHSALMRAVAFSDFCESYEGWLSRVQAAAKARRKR
jgi:hypothetical protein